ncbi:uncharacterized protein LOC131641828 [Vicia villosa]|uniref:uncharacterized protein LOC131641828 n=1 Tax=Vicia villosa TaxID=3911 RepID=UPI00273B15C2|nr:uncharacterized protein LOC131641828 [Vicia villosa]
MAGNNNNVNVRNPDPFHLDNLIQGSAPKGTNRHRREGQQHTADGQGRSRHETSQPNRRQQPQNVEQVQNGGNEQPQPQNGPEQAQNLNETDARDGQVASLFTHTSERRRVQYEDEQEQVDIPEEADSTTVLLLKELQKTNRLIRLQGDRIDELERKRRYRSPPRRYYRSRSYSSSRSPPGRYHRRSPSSSRSPPKRYHRQRSYSCSLPQKSRNNQRPEDTEIGSLSLERDSRGPSKAVLKPRERSPPRDNRKNPGKTQGKPRRNRHSTSPGPSDEEDFRSPLSESIRRARLPRGMEKPPTLDLYDGTTNSDDHIRSTEAVMDYHVVRGSIKCRIFPTTLRKGAMTWYRNLPPNSIHSWTELKELFLSHFTASRRQPKSEANLEAVIQGTNEPLRKIPRQVQQRDRSSTDDRLHEEIPPRARTPPRKRFQKGYKNREGAHHERPPPQGPSLHRFRRRRSSCDKGFKGQRCCP